MWIKLSIVVSHILRFPFFNTTGISWLKFLMCIVLVLSSFTSSPLLIAASCLQIIVTSCYWQWAPAVAWCSIGQKYSVFLCSLLTFLDFTNVIFYGPYISDGWFLCFSLVVCYSLHHMCLLGPYCGLLIFFPSIMDSKVGTLEEALQAKAAWESWQSSEGHRKERIAARKAARFQATQKIERKVMLVSVSYLLHWNFTLRQLAYRQELVMLKTSHWDDGLHKNYIASIALIQVTITLITVSSALFWKLTYIFIDVSSLRLLRRS